MTKGNEFNVKHARRILAHPSDRNSITPIRLPVQPGLGPIRLVHDDNRPVRRRRTAHLLRLGDVLAHGGNHIVYGRWGTALKGQRHAGSVPIEDRNAVTRGRDSDLLVLEADVAGLHPAEDLACFSLELVLFAGDVRDNVVEDVHAGDAGVAGARDGLHGDDAGGADRTETGDESGEGNGNARDGAVGVADDEAGVEAVCLALMWDQGEVVDVHGRDDERHVRRKTVVLCVGKDGEFGFEEFHLCWW